MPRQPVVRHNDWSVLAPATLGDWEPTLSVTVVVPRDVSVKQTAERPRRDTLRRTLRRTLRTSCATLPPILFALRLKLRSTVYAWSLPSAPNPRLKNS